jgi:1-acyl-sn-glycerol-3-phosphate acyltransferase
MWYYFGAIPSTSLAKLLFRISVKGKHYLPRKGGVIVASNHRSNLDPVVLGWACRPRELSFMAREDLFRVPVFGTIISLVGAFPVKRDSADRGALKEALRRVNKLHHGLVLFPEGTRQQEGVVAQAKAGVGFLAVKSRVPVVPVYISGSGEALPRGARRIRLKKISVEFGPPLRFEQGLAYEEVADRIMDAIRRIAHQHSA